MTSNRIHLPVYGGPDREAIPRPVQLIAGRTAREYNQRKRRSGAFLEDRYHATAADTEIHPTRCLIYIDLSMVSAGIVGYPGEWRHCGHRGLMAFPRRYRIIARDRLRDLPGAGENFHELYAGWVREAIAVGSAKEAFWSESVAAGSPAFVEEVRHRLGIKGSGRKIRSLEGTDLHKNRPRERHRSEM